MKNLVEMITILLGLFTLFFGILQYFWQKRFDEKLRVYKNYLAVVALSILSPEKQREIQLQQKHLLSKQELVLFAPEEIVELAGKIEPINFTKNNEQKHLE